MPLLCLRLLSEAREAEGNWTLASEWLIHNDDGSTRGQGVTDYRGLTDLLDPGLDWIGQPGNVLVLVPHDQLLELNVTVPGRSAAQIRKALPYAVEEFTTTDIEDLHIACGPIRPGVPIRVQLIERGLLQGWLDCLRSLGLEPGSMVADTELLVSTGSETGYLTMVLLDGSGALVRSEDEAATVDRANLAVALQSIAPRRLRFINGKLTTEEEALLPETVIEYVEYGGSSIEYLAAHRGHGTPVNLLQGSFAPVHKRTNGTSGWSRVALAASIWVAVAWFLMLGEAWWASHRAQTLAAEAGGLFAQWFPDAGPVRNPRRALAERLGHSAAGTVPGFAVLTADLVAALQPGAAIRSLEFERERGELRTEVMLADHGEVEALRTRLAGSGIDAELLNATQEESMIRALIVLRRSS